MSETTALSTVPQPLPRITESLKLFFVFKENEKGHTKKEKEHTKREKEKAWEFERERAIVVLSS